MSDKEAIRIVTSLSRFREWLAVKETEHASHGLADAWEATAYQHTRLIRTELDKLIRGPAWNPPENGRPSTPECTNHWHCDPLLSAHVCNSGTGRKAAADRTKPCPSYGAL